MRCRARETSFKKMEKRKKEEKKNLTDPNCRGVVYALMTILSIKSLKSVQIQIRNVSESKEKGGGSRTTHTICPIQTIYAYGFPKTFEFFLIHSKRSMKDQC